MRRVKNAFVKSTPEYMCFGCSPKNKQGLQMEFFENDATVWSEWQPRSEFDGWKGVVHGGIQATLMDETGEWYVFVKHGRSAVTMELNCRYKKPLSSDKGKISIKATEISFRRNISEIEISVYDTDGDLCSQAKGKFYVFSEQESKEKYKFPGKGKF
ncbi:MAG: PaaI family thioesterase [Bacteroidales bacterium]|nr:PaaI family thioesterase [Bacteroidales bacterium]